MGAAWVELRRARRERGRGRVAAPRRLTPPTPRAVDAGVAAAIATPALALSLLFGGQAEQALWTSSAFDCDAAQSLDVGAAAKADGGTVGLEGLLAADAEPAARAPRQAADAPTRGEAPNRSPAPTAPPAPAEPPGSSLAERLSLLLQPPLELLLAHAGPLEWPAAFFPYQQDGIKALVSRPHLLLADDMGLGKTIQTIAALRILVRRHEIGSALLVLPASLVLQWKRAIREWAPELRTSTITGAASNRALLWRTPAHLYLTSYETLRQDFSQRGSPVRRTVWDVVVLDEAQKIKNRDSETARACKRLQRNRSWALTGTPLENDVTDLASICEFLTSWQEGDELLLLDPARGLLARHRELQLRRKKSDVLSQLPPKSVNEVALTLTSGQRRSYDEAEQTGVIHLRELGQTITITHVLALIQRLKQICNVCPSTGESAKLVDIAERLETLASTDHRALIFSQYTDEKFGARWIAERLARFHPLLYTGDLSSSERDRRITEFTEQPERKALVLSLRAGGQGLNLQEASYVFHFDRWWNPAVERQAEDRSHRLGQNMPVTVYKYVCEDTIEERIDEILKRKQVLFDEIVDDVSLDLGKTLTRAEIFGLFDLTPPAGRSHSEVRGLTGEGFERHLADLLRARGWRAELTQRSRDGGIDLELYKSDEIGIESAFSVQCKNQRAAVPVEVVRELNGVLDANVRGIVASPSGFTADARTFAEERGIVLWGPAELDELARPAG